MTARKNHSGRSAASFHLLLGTVGGAHVKEVVQYLFLSRSHAKLACKRADNATIGAVNRLKRESSYVGPVRHEGG